MAWDSERIPGAERGELVTITIDDGSELLILADAGFRVVGWRQSDGTEVVAGHREDLAHQKPTRSGIPVLFPWPNRIAGGRFTWHGAKWSMPITEPAHGNAIHGLAVAAAWSWAAEGDSITGTYLLPPGEWPGEGSLSLTYRLAPGRLLLTAVVANTGTTDLPFGLGFHPYFTALGARSVDDAELWCPAQAAWPLVDGVPAGAAEPVTGPLLPGVPRRVGDLHLDDALTDLPPGGGGWQELGWLAGPAGRLTVAGDASWREVVLYTSVDRDSLAIEPYTCPTNAVNMADPAAAGWLSLPPGKRWQAHLEYRFDPAQ